MRGEFGGGDEAVSLFPRREDWEFRYVKYNILYWTAQVGCFDVDSQID